MDYSMSRTGELTVLRRSSSTLDIQWKIKGFVSLDGGWHSSPSFCFGGQSWHLRVWDGRDVFIHIRRESFQFPVILDVSTSFETSTGKKMFEEHRRCVFMKEHEFVILQISGSEFFKRQSDLLPSHRLTILCTLRQEGSSENEKDVSDLQILKLSHYSAPVTGGREVILLCGQVNENDTEILFYEEDEKGERIWSDTVKFSPEDVHLQGAISFKTPPYKTTNIQKEIDCFICLRRPSDGAVGESKEFTLFPPKEGLPCSSESSVDVQENEIQLDFKQLFLSKEECDVIIKVKDQEFPAHKIILMARSPVLSSAFRNEMKEKSTNTLEIDDCEPSSFSEFLCYLYSGIANISTENVFSLFTTADKYDVQGLRKKCLNILKGNLSEDTFCETITLALLHSETELIELTTDFFIKNAPKILVTAKWQLFLAENPTYANELIVKFATSVSSLSK